MNGVNNLDIIVFINDSLDSLEAIIEYTFKNKDYLCNALTHSSFANECKAQKNQVSSNERLEFLGDSVLSIAVSGYIFNSLTEEQEEQEVLRLKHLGCFQRYLMM